MMRRAGTILHISSLPSPYGIGTMGREAYEFVDFLKKAGLRYWQVLPLVPAGSGNSPYASYSTFAGNPDFIDLDFLCRLGLLDKEEVEKRDWGKNPRRVDFEAVHQNKQQLLEKAYSKLKDEGKAEVRKAPKAVQDVPKDPSQVGKVSEQAKEEKARGRAAAVEDALISALRKRHSVPTAEAAVGMVREEPLKIEKEVSPTPLSLDALEQFRLRHSGWVEDYALYMAVKEANGQLPWFQWPKDIAMREDAAMADWSENVKDRVNFWVFVQYVFFTQWEALKFYANENDIEIIGDIPIYVFHDSVDVWANRKYFWLDRENLPVKVAGVPPDAFSDVGQRWGNPLYRWDVLEEEDYSWWVHRIRRSEEIYDWVRIDHFRGFDQFYAIDRGQQDARRGEWCEGPGVALFQQVEKELGRVKILAEDLGVITPSVQKLLKATGFPGMKVLQFACSGPDNAYLPHNCEENAFIYTGTHDNDTAVGWMQNGNPKETAFARMYFGLNEAEGYHWGLIRGALCAKCAVAMVQMQDFLGMGSEDRMNVPATPSGNWGFRMEKGRATGALAEKIHKLLYCFGRLN